ncbi:hypothetical protein TNCV_646841 [Trichonephila clavipes]|nr:hypothetical protein TNCV_646841 [Trichonephila clavipes]
MSWLIRFLRNGKDANTLFVVFIRNDCQEVTKRVGLALLRYSTEGHGLALPRAESGLFQTALLACFLKRSRMFFCEGICPVLLLLPSRVSRA